MLSDILEQSTSTYSYLDSKCNLVSHTTTYEYILSNYDYTNEYSTNKKNENLSDDIFIFIAFLPHNVFRSLNNFTKNETFKIENSLLCEIFVKIFNIIPMLYNEHLFYASEFFSNSVMVYELNEQKNNIYP